MEWQPIETAPKDGTPVLIAIWAWDKPGGERLYYWAACYGGRWCEPGLDLEFFDPTHWMPLPAPPKE